MAVATFQGTVHNGQVHLAADVHLPENATVFVVVPDFEPATNAKKFDLHEMVARMPKDYQPHEEDWGEPVGKEEW
jgi:antitoxin component of MazEF toxin-antitoxin module